MIEGEGGPPLHTRIGRSSSAALAGMSVKQIGDIYARSTIEGSPAPTLPGSVKVGFKTYAIAPWPLIQSLDYESVGVCEHNISVIRVITEGRPPQDAAETLLHEIFHACWHVSRLDEVEEEERSVATLSSSFAQVLRDNPELRDYLAAVYA